MIPIIAEAVVMPPLWGMLLFFIVPSAVIDFIVVALLKSRENHECVIACSITGLVVWVVLSVAVIGVTGMDLVLGIIGTITCGGLAPLIRKIFP